MIVVCSQYFCSIIDESGLSSFLLGDISVAVVVDNRPQVQTLTH